MSDHGSLDYLTGFGNEFESEALPGALPIGQFSPQKPAYGLYAEQFSSTAFTAPRARNRRNWYYRIRPSARQGPYYPVAHSSLKTAPLTTPPIPDRLRWDAPAVPDAPTDFIDGLLTMAANGDCGAQIGIAVHYYRANAVMRDRYFCNADGEMLLVPQLGALRLRTECGQLSIRPGEIAVIPRGMKFAATPEEGAALGYIAENYGQLFELPERGPVGANGYANDRDFCYPVAAFEDRELPCQLLTKFCGRLFASDLAHSPLDVVAWTGNSAPYKYDLARFNVINTVSYDHPDPSIFTVLTSPSGEPGVANMDFVIFPERWAVAEHSFRPPYFHRNIMSEFMGLIHGAYDAKDGGFVPGGASLHNCMSPHGPDAAVFESASEAQLLPERYRDTLAFMFESRYVLAPSEEALQSATRQQDYEDCWSGLARQFNGNRSPAA